jgi:hypothetical protein
VGPSLRDGHEVALGLQGPAQPSPTIGDALNAGYGDFDVLDLVKIFLLGTDFTDFVRIAQQRADQPLAPQFARLYLKVRSLRAGGKAAVVNDVARRRRYAARLLRHTLRMSTPQEDSHSLLTQLRFGSLSQVQRRPSALAAGECHIPVGRSPTWLV